MKGAGTPKGLPARARQAPRRGLIALDRGARYLTPTGRVCRVVGANGDEVTLAYEEPVPGTGPATLSERLTLTRRAAMHTLVRVG